MEINIEDVMNEIRAEIKEKGYTADMLSFEDVVKASPVSVNTDRSAIDDLHGAIVYLNTSYTVPESIPVKGNAIVRFVKKVIRKLCRFYVKPIVMTQNEFNALCVRAFNDVNAYIDETSKTSVTELENKVNMLELKLKTVTAENEKLVKRIEALEGSAG